MKRYLVLENGAVFEGEAFGADAEVISEIVFLTSMTGYVEALTDKNFAGQAVCQTFPLIGNYGVNEEDMDADRIIPDAWIVRENCDTPSNFRCRMTTDEFLKKHGVPGITGIDTRALTKILRDNGTMNGLITSNPENADLEKIAAFRVSGKVASVSTDSVYRVVSENGAEAKKVALLDLGVKGNLVSSLTKHGCDVTVLPYNTDAKAILALEPDGIVISGGPGEPSEIADVVETVRVLFESGIPMMGVDLGHEVMALANGMKVEKLVYGHRGASYPVKCLLTGKLFITAQNHGYAVSEVNPDVAEELFVNVNDKTVEGVSYKNIPAFSVQFMPESCGGAQDTSYVFEHFVEMMK